MKKPALMAVIFGLFAVLFTALYLTSIETKYKKGIEKVKVLTAKAYIDQGTTLTREILEEKMVPKEYLQPKAIQSIKELYDQEGRAAYVAIVPIEQGEQVMTTKLTMVGVETGISSIIPTDKRAITLIFDSDEINGLIKPGNRVDIIGTFEFTDKRDSVQEETVTVLQNVLVLAVGGNLLGAAPKKNETNNDDTADQGSRLPVSFAVYAGDIQVLAMAAEKGKIRLSVRPVGDDKIFDSKATKLSNISREAVSGTQSVSTGETARTQDYMKEMQKKQREALEMLKKYQQR